MNPLSRALLIPLLLLALHSPLLHADDSPLTPRHTTADADVDLSRLTFKGVTPQRAAELRSALQRSPHVLLAATPSNSSLDFATQLHRALISLYEKAGYADTSVSITGGKHPFRLEINEGTLATNGKIVVKNARALNPQSLVRTLTTDALTTTAQVRMDKDRTFSIGLAREGPHIDKALWKAGEHCRFNEEFKLALAREINLAFAFQGYFFADSSFNSEPVRPNTPVDLLVTVKTENAPATLSKITFIGLKSTSVKDALAFLNLAADSLLTLDLLLAAYEKLYASGRFSKHTLTVVPTLAGPASLTIELEEIPNAPALNDPLSPKQKAALKTCQWLNAALLEQDLTIDAQAAANGKVQFIFSAKQGAHFTGRLSPDAPVISLHFSSNAIAYESENPSLRYFLQSPSLPLPVFPQLHLLPRNFKIGAGFDTKLLADPASIRPDILVTPAAFLDILGREDTSSSLENNTLTVSFKNFTLIADADTGQIREAIYTLNKTDSARLTFSKNALAQQIEKLAASKLPNACNPKQPYTSFLRTLAFAYLNSFDSLRTLPPEDRTRAQLALAKLLDDRALLPLEPLFTSHIASLSNPNALTCPIPKEFTDGLNSTQIICLEFLILSSASFDPSSWPWTLSRETLLNLASRAPHTRKEASRLLQSNNTGPLASLLAAQLLSTTKSPALKELFASLANERLTDSALTTDLQPLLLGNAPIPTTLRNLLQNFQSLTLDELAALSKLLPEKYTPILKSLHAALQKDPEKPLETRLPQITKSLWPQLKPLFESALKPHLPTPIQFEIAPP